MGTDGVEPHYLRTGEWLLNLFEGLGRLAAWAQTVWSQTTSAEVGGCLLTALWLCHTTQHDRPWGGGLQQLRWGLGLESMPLTVAPGGHATPGLMPPATHAAFSLLKTRRPPVSAFTPPPKYLAAILLEFFKRRSVQRTAPVNLLTHPLSPPPVAADPARVLQALLGAAHGTGPPQLPRTCGDDGGGGRQGGWLGGLMDDLQWQHKAAGSQEAVSGI